MVCRALLALEASYQLGRVPQAVGLSFCLFCACEHSSSRATFSGQITVHVMLKEPRKALIVKMASRANKRFRVPSFSELEQSADVPDRTILFSKRAVDTKQHDRKDNSRPGTPTSAKSTEPLDLLRAQFIQQTSQVSRFCRETHDFQLNLTVRHENLTFFKENLPFFSITKNFKSLFKNQAIL